MDFVRFSIYFLLLIRVRGVFFKGVADWVFHDPLRYPHRTHPPLSCPGMRAARTKIVINVFIVIWYINDISSPRAGCGMAAISLCRTRTVGPFFWSHRYNRTPRILTHELLLEHKEVYFPRDAHPGHTHTSTTPFARTELRSKRFTYRWRRMRFYLCFRSLGERNKFGRRKYARQDDGNRSGKIAAQVDHWFIHRTCSKMVPNVSHASRFCPGAVTCGTDKPQKAGRVVRGNFNLSRSLFRVVIICWKLWY